MDSLFLPPSNPPFRRPAIMSFENPHDGFFIFPPPDVARGLGISHPPSSTRLPHSSEPPLLFHFFFPPLDLQVLDPCVCLPFLPPPSFFCLDPKSPCVLGTLEQVYPTTGFRLSAMRFLRFDVDSCSWAKAVPSVSLNRTFCSVSEYQPMAFRTPSSPSTAIWPGLPLPPIILRISFRG